MIALIGGIVLGFILGTICYRLDIPRPPVGGKLILDMSNSDEVIYQLIIFDQSGEKMKNLKQVLVDIEVSDEVKKHEADTD